MWVPGSRPLWGMSIRPPVSGCAIVLAVPCSGHAPSSGCAPVITVPSSG